MPFSLCFGSISFRKSVFHCICNLFFIKLVLGWTKGGSCPLVPALELLIQGPSARRGGYTWLWAHGPGVWDTVPCVSWIYSSRDSPQLGYVRKGLLDTSRTCLILCLWIFPSPFTCLALPCCLHTKHSIQNLCLFPEKTCTKDSGRSPWEPMALLPSAVSGVLVPKPKRIRALQWVTTWDTAATANPGPWVRQKTG